MSQMIQSQKILLTFFIILIAAVLAVGYGVYWIADRYFAPVYARGCDITSVAWGKDGSLYMLVRWAIWKPATFIDPLGKTAEDFPLPDGGYLVYRLDPDERVLRKLDMEEGRRIRAQWPNMSLEERNARRIFQAGELAQGWVGGRWRVHMELHKIPLDTAGYEFAGLILTDWSTGETTHIPGWNVVPSYNGTNIVLMSRVSPDDRYLTFVDSATRRFVIRWLPAGAESLVPESIIPLNATIYPTTEGLLDPSRQLLIDPVTFETRAGWNIPQHISGTNLGPNGRSNCDRPTGSRIAINLEPPGWGAIWSGPASEYSTWILPTEWLHLSNYPEQMQIQNPAPQS